MKGIAVAKFEPGHEASINGGLAQKLFRIK